MWATSRRREAGQCHMWWLRMWQEVEKVKQKRALAGIEYEEERSGGIS